ncbi:MAG: DUF3352 domain-containing protein [Verrucomicrobiota bacterium]
MKAIRVVLILVLALLVIGGGVVGYIMYSRSQVPTATQLLPAETMVFAHIPNGAVTGASYYQSKLAQVFNAEEVQAAGTLAWSQMVEQMGTGGLEPEQLETLQRAFESLAYCFSGESFLAITEVDIAPNALEPLGLVGGFHPLPGGEASYNDMVAELKSFHDSLADEVKLTTGQGSYGGMDYDFLETTDKTGRLYLLKTGSWILIATKEDLIQATIDRLQGKETGPSLEDSADYKQAMASFDPAPDLVTYINVPAYYRTMMDMMRGIADTPGVQPQDLKTMENAFDLYRNVKGVALGTAFQSDGLIKDQWVGELAPELVGGLGSMMAPCEYRTLRFTDQSTIFYLGSTLDAPGYFDAMMKIYEGVPMISDNIAAVEQGLQEMGLDLHKNILEALGSEYAIVSSWPQGGPAPYAGFLVTLKDEAAFRPAMEKMVVTLKENTREVPGGQSSGRWVKAKIGNFEADTYEMPDSQLSPTLIIGDDLAGIFLTQKGAATILSSPAEGNFTKLAAWKELGLNPEGSSNLLYLDLPEVLDRTWSMTAPMLKMMMAFSPDMQKQLGGVEIPDKLAFLEAVSAMGQVSFLKGEAYTQDAVSTFGSPVLLLTGVMGAALQVLGDQFQQQSTEIAGSLDEEPMMDEPTAVPPPEPAPVDPTSAGAIRDELNDLRVVVSAWAQQNQVPTGATVEWAAIKNYLIPGSRLAESGGRDALGNRFKLGRVDEVAPDVDYQTKQAFPDLPPGFWKESSLAPAPAETPVPTPDAPPVEDTVETPAEAPAS